ncbi:Yip1 family protein [Natronomonas sp. EA1]|uniref:Yip1 family protein n=1 Tax=Natronomonas sp. EA1 TaxID=3421655 RepID=UPI003EBE3F90
MLDLLFNPDAFFRERAENPGLVPSVALLVLVGLVGVAGTLPALQATIDALPQEAQAFGTISLVVGSAFAFLGPFVRWVLYAAAFHVLSSVVYDAERGSFRDLLALVGWGFVPALLAAIVSAVVATVVFSGVTFPSDPQQVAQFSQQLRNRPEFLVASVLGIAFLLWSAFLWTFAVKHVRDLTMREAGVVVGVPVALGLVFRVWGVVI